MTKRSDQVPNGGNNLPAARGDDDRAMTKRSDREHRRMVAAMLVAPLERTGGYPAEQLQILRQRIERALANEYKRGVYGRDSPAPERSQATIRGWKTRKDNERRRKKIELDRARVRGLSAHGLLPERVE